MKSSSGQSNQLSFDAEALGRTQEWVVYDRGLEYTGEVIVSEAVEPAWGRRLEGSVSFRHVFFTVPRRIPSGLIQDPRIAMAVPRRPLHQVWRAIGRELGAIHEARERYQTARDRDALALRESMDAREASLRGEMARNYGVSYSQGRVYAHSRVRVRPGDIFVGESPESWVDRLAVGVFRQAYPSLPLDHGDFPSPITSDTISALYRGLLQDSNDAASIVRAYGPGLGLSRPESPGGFDAADCPAIAFIREELEERQGQMPAGELLDLLAYEHGIPRSLATLYLMAFVRHARSEVDLQPGHRVENRRGGQFLSDRLSWDLVPEVSFSRPLADFLGTLRLQSSPTWNTILPYASLVVEGLGLGQDAADVEAQEGRLLRALGDMAPEVDAAMESLRLLEASLGRGPTGAVQVLQRVRTLCGVSSYQGLYSVCLEGFAGPSELGDTLDRYRRVRRLAELVPSIGRTKRYLDLMTFGPDNHQLLVERDTLLARIEPDSLMASPWLWGGIEESFRRLLARYSRTYVAHHLRYFEEAQKISHRLEGLSLQVEALVRFNGMPELGEPVGTEVPRLYEEVAASFRTCSALRNGLSLESTPYCQSCQLPLEQGIPRGEVELLFGAADRAMREYNRRLGTQTVRQILAHPTKEQLDKFIDLVRVADPSALANVLDDPVVEFLRQFLSSG